MRERVLRCVGFKISIALMCSALLYLLWLHGVGKRANDSININ